MKILLINPNSKRKIGKSNRVSSVIHPLGLAYIAAVLKKENFNVRILDADALNLHTEEILKIIDSFKPDIVGFNVKTTAISSVLRIAEKIKNNFSDIKIVLGGPHTTACPEELAKNKFIDFFVIGEGEFTMLELVKEIQGKKNFKKIRGLVFKKGNKMIINPRRASITDLDSLPFPALELLPLSKYVSGSSRNKKFISILTSRGCPGKCIHCNKLVFGDVCFMRTAENLIKEIEFLIKTYGYKEFHIVDDVFTNDRERVVEFCNILIKKNIKIEWKCGNGIRVGSVDFELLKLMKKAGCYSLSFGVESGNQEILNKMKKGQTLKQIEDAVKFTKKAGIECVCFFILGNLGENERTMQETINFAKKLNPDAASFSIMTPYPGTLVRFIIEKEGKIFEKNWENYDHLQGKSVFEHGELRREIVERMYKKAYKEFYMRPEYIVKRVFKKRTLTEFKKEINGFLALLEM